MGKVTVFYLQQFVKHYTIVHTTLKTN